MQIENELLNNSVAIGLETKMSDASRSGDIIGETVERLPQTKRLDIKTILSFSGERAKELANGNESIVNAIGLVFDPIIESAQREIRSIN